MFAATSLVALTLAASTLAAPSLQARDGCGSSATAFADRAGPFQLYAYANSLGIPTSVDQGTKLVITPLIEVGVGGGSGRHFALSTSLPAREDTPFFLSGSRLIGNDTNNAQITAGALTPREGTEFTWMVPNGLLAAAPVFCGAPSTSPGFGPPFPLLAALDEFDDPRADGWSICTAREPEFKEPAPADVLVFKPVADDQNDGAYDFSSCYGVIVGIIDSQ
ncbi:uncharacterized protein BXZ73DRAFT_99414 [Epithele typhae]|uniref:uncharacterized protein n=1 Tax=Epithele typhae TaxID=378194 RepID=UPI002008AB79|nr:uncharacterized protein BXZ73DRAFT_99414 [Epithele typhae]KAH9939783.1 hypothetical protein BXZ73DRAFT_99414 [Epithele typhae]